MILNGLLTKLIKKGHLVWIDHSGNELNYGDKSGKCIKIKTFIPISGTKLILSPEIYIGELYMDGQLKVVDASIFDLLKLVFSNMTSENSHWILKLSRNISKMKSKYIQNNFIIKSKKNVAHHYDLSDRLYDLFLDKDRQYSCAYFKSTNDSLAKAQKNKKELIGKKLILSKNDKVLDIGSGWGGMAQYLAEKYKAKVK
jgi:cyclopropane-fatty-acyl-phospholipid synthase